MASPSAEKSETPGTAVLVVDSDSVARSFTRRLLEKIDGVRVVADCTAAEIGADAIRRLGVGVVIVDWAGLGHEEQAVVRDVAVTGPAVLALVDAPEVASASLDALSAGVTGLLVKDASMSRRLGEAVLDVAAGGVVLAPQLAKLLTDRIRLDHTGLEGVGPEVLRRLTRRELDVLAHLGVPGRTNSQIAHLLGISAATVKSHVSRVLSKMRLHTREEAARFARQHVLMPPPDRPWGA